jgi:hypothetical protein
MGVIRLELSAEEANFLNSAMSRHLAEMEDELVHTDKHELQRALATDIERFRAIAQRLDRLVKNAI